MNAGTKWHNRAMANSTALRLFMGVALVTAVIGGTLTAVWPDRQPDPASAEADMVGTVLPEPRTLPTVNLTDHNAERWTRESLTGRWQFLFFGFTHCPDVCPMTLATLAGTLERIEKAGADRRPGVVMITVDPRRDTPATMKRYVRHFSDDFTGVTGERDEIDRLTEALGISYTLHEPGADGDYAVDHSAAILLIDPQGRLRALWQPPHGRAVLAEEFRRISRWYAAGGRS